MSAEEVQETTADDTESTEGVEPTKAQTPEDKDAIISKLRKENAKRRIDENANAAKLKEFEDWKKSQMTELEKAQADRDEATRERDVLKTEKLRDKVAKKFKLDDDIVEFLGTGTEEEMEERAAKLAPKESEKDEKGKPTDAGKDSNGLFGGDRGKHVEPKSKSSTGWLKDMFNE